MSDARANGYIRIIMRRPFKAMTSVIALMAFVFNTLYYDIAWADRTPSVLTSVGTDPRAVSPVSPGTFKELNVKTFNLPQSLGTIKDSWSPAPSTLRRGPSANYGLAQDELRPSVVVHIQDAHCNYYAQHTITAILEYLTKEYGISTINLEGGTAEYDLDAFTRIKDKEVRERVADFFVKEGVVSGAEYFALNNPDKAQLWGVEDEGLYIDNLKVYRDSLSYKDNADKLLKNLSYLLTNLKMKIYSKALLELDLKYNQYKSGSIEFKDYISYLVANAKDKLIDIKAYPNIFLLNQVLKQEGDIDFAKANTEQDLFINKIGKRLSKNSLKELVARTVDFRADKISQVEFYRYLVNKAKDADITVENFPELEKYIVYISSYAAIDKSKIIAETGSLEDSIRDSLFRNDKERELDRLSRNLAILKNIFNISLTRADYQYYKNNTGDFAMKNYISFISREAPLCNINAKTDDGIARLDGYRADILKFYEYSFKRDIAFMRNIKFTKDERRKTNDARQVSIVITGGFHTENLCELFKKNKIAYVSIIPNFKPGEGYECPYYGLLAGKQNILDARISTMLGSALAVASILNRLGIKVEGQAARHILDIRIALETAVQANGGRIALFNANETIVIDADLKVLDEDAGGLPRVNAADILKPFIAVPMSAVPTLTGSLDRAGVVYDAKNNRWDWSGVKPDADWVMDEMHEMEIKPIVETLDEMPPAGLISSLDDMKALPVLSTRGRADLRLNMIDIAGRQVPCVVKILKKTDAVEREYIAAQIYERLGIGPRLYGIVKDASGKAVGYAMEVVIGESVIGTKLQERLGKNFVVVFKDLAKRIAGTGIDLPGEYMITRIGKVAAIDAGEMKVVDPSKFAAFKQKLAAGPSLTKDEEGAMSSPQLISLMSMAAAGTAVALMGSIPFWAMILGGGGFIVFAFPLIAGIVKVSSPLASMPPTVEGALPGGRVGYMSAKEIKNAGVETLIEYFRNRNYDAVEEARIREALIWADPGKLAELEEGLMRLADAPAPVPESYPRFEPRSAGETALERETDRIIAEEPFLADFRPILRELLLRYGSVESLSGKTGLELGPYLKVQFLRHLRQTGADVEAVDKASAGIPEGELTGISHSVVKDYNEYVKGCAKESRDFVYSKFGLYANLPAYAPEGDTRSERIRARFEPITAALKPGGLIICVYKLGEEDELLTEEEMRSVGLEGTGRYYENLPGEAGMAIVSVMRKPVPEPSAAAKPVYYHGTSYALEILRDKAIKGGVRPSQSAGQGTVAFAGEPVGSAGYGQHVTQKTIARVIKDAYPLYQKGRRELVIWACSVFALDDPESERELLKYMPDKTTWGRHAQKFSDFVELIAPLTLANGCKPLGVILGFRKDEIERIGIKNGILQAERYDIGNELTELSFENEKDALTFLTTILRYNVEIPSVRFRIYKASDIHGKNGEDRYLSDTKTRELIAAAKDAATRWQPNEWERMMTDLTGVAIPGIGMPPGVVLASSAAAEPAVPGVALKSTASPKLILPAERPSLPAKIETKPPVTPILATETMAAANTPLPVAPITEINSWNAQYDKVLAWANKQDLPEALPEPVREIAQETAAAIITFSGMMEVTDEGLSKELAEFGFNNPSDILNLPDEELRPHIIDYLNKTEYVDKGMHPVGTPQRDKIEKEIDNIANTALVLINNWKAMFAAQQIIGDEMLQSEAQLAEYGITGADLMRLRTPDDVNNFVNERGFTKTIKDLLNRVLATQYRCATTVNELDREGIHDLYVNDLGGTTLCVLGTGDMGIFTATVSVFGPVSPVTVNIVRAKAEPALEPAMSANAAAADTRPGKADCVILARPARDTTVTLGHAADIDNAIARKYGALDDTHVTGYKYSKDYSAEAFSDSIAAAIDEAINYMARKERESRDKDPRTIILAPARKFADAKGAERTSSEIIAGILEKKDREDEENAVKEKRPPKAISKLFTVVRENVPGDGLIYEAVHIDLGKMLLNYEREKDRFSAAEADRLLGFIRAVVSRESLAGVKDEDIVNGILNGTITLDVIRPIDIDKDWKKSQAQYIKLRTSV
ncbi:MAG: hypothetical protein WC522_00920 [Candidatus Omnitrophota bacterium]